MRAPESSYSKDEMISRLNGKAAASETSDSEVSDTSSSSSASDVSSQSSVADAQETTSTKESWRPEFGFAFDIDGVLLHKSNPIPGATDTLKYLQKHRIPFILLTNGGGKSEADRVAELSAKLGVDLDTSNFVQSHTPYQLLATETPMSVPQSRLPRYLREKVGLQSLRDSTVLVLGSDASQARRIAQGYGFQSVVTPGDILHAHPEIFPFNPLSEFYSKQEILPLPKPVWDPKGSNGEIKDCLKIDAILVFNDPRDWAFDIQLITDLLLSHRGYLGTYSKRNGDPSLPRNQRWQGDGQPALVYSNVDLLWSTGYHQPRFGQGAFRAAVRGAFNKVIKETETANASTIKIRDFNFGKPQPETYHYAASKLFDHFTSMWRKAPGSENNNNHNPELTRLKKVYMVGDNPQSDIRGVVNWRTAQRTLPIALKKDEPEWEACLVRTGVWDEEKVPLTTLELRNAKPDTVQDDVKTVLNWVLEKQGWPERLD
ncbi:hypothetical protein N0V82_002949 [Gnomoniopsis sp. IMI 355080]|nr:hypothetical protein N0V82_002949 [Gnomoniopsis sp. IMI 355080]